MDGHQFRGARIYRDMMLVSSVCRRALGCEWEVKRRTHSHVDEEFWGRPVFAPRGEKGGRTRARGRRVPWAPRRRPSSDSSQLGWRARCHTGCSTRRAGPRRGVPPCFARRSPSQPAGRWPPASVGAPAPLRRPPTFSAATISPPPTRRAASTARLTRLLLSSDLLCVSGWSVLR